MMKQVFLVHTALFSIYLVFCPGIVHAAHPLITDDAGTTGTGKFQFELNGEYAHDDEDGVTTKETEVAASLTYGITETLDVVIGIPYGWGEVSEDAETVSNHGVGDMSVEVKWKVFEGDGLSLALKPGFTIPTGDEDEGLGTGKATYSVFAIVSKELDPFAFHLNGGYIRNESDFDDRRDLWHVSLAGEYEINESCKLVANIGQEKNPGKESDVNPAFILGGVIYSISDNLDVDFGVKAGLNEAEADYALLAGITLKF